MSFRLGLSDGVSIVAARWAEAFDELGYAVRTVAGEGPVDHVIPGLAIGATAPPTAAELGAALDDVDLVVVENLCTIPMNLPASRAVGSYLRGRPTIMHHHDPPWQRERYGHIDELPIHDPAWRHVTINELTRHQMASRGFEAVTIYNPFRTDEAPGDRAAVRSGLGVADDELLVAHPVRAIARKNIPLALRLAEELEGTYWLLGEAEEGYGSHLDWLLSTSQVPVIRQPSASIPDIYAAADVVVFPSLWEGFGNPPIEASIHRKPVIVGSYPVAEELAALGFTWFRPDQLDEVRRLVVEPDVEMLDRNRALAIEKFSIEASKVRISTLIEEAGW
ncbi:MAG: glycosyltransferase family 4 protein [Actinomycetota bacterium]